MKKTIRTIAVLAGLLVLAGCQKENTEWNNTMPTGSGTSLYYNAGGEVGQTLLTSDEAWDLFMQRMLALAREGYVVVISPTNGTSGHSTKEVVTFTTDSEDEAKQWSKEMTLNGYDVIITYDDKTGIYTCIATR